MTPEQWYLKLKSVWLPCVHILTHGYVHTETDTCVHAFIRAQINRPQRKRKTTISHSHREAKEAVS